MQITLNQTEIETAIKNYVNDRMTVNEGADYDIDLRASRGPEGFTAIIDLNEDAEPEEAAPTGPAKRNLGITEKVKAVKAEKGKDRATEPDPEPEEEKEVDEKTSKEVSKEATDGKVVDDPTDAATNETEGLDEAEGDIEVPKEKSKSLFAGLKKPKND